MKFRGRQNIADQDEQRAVDELRSALEHKSGYDPVLPPGSYWSNLVVRVNQRLDSATSSRGLSVSWAARVAIPGVVAIISFYIGLHYYVPGQSQYETAVAPILASLPQAEMDSLFAEQLLGDGTMHEAVFDMTGEDAAQYCISNGEPSLVIEMLSDMQVEKLLTSLTSHKKL